MFKSEIGYNELRLYLKNILGYRFKRGSSRVPLSKKKELIFCQAIFSWRLLSDLYRERIVVNVDETSYGRSVKENYSCLPKGSTYPVINTIWEGRINMTFGLCSNGKWIAFIQDQNGTTKTFQVFLIFLKYYIDSWLEINSTPIQVVLDNAALHLTESTKNVAKILSIELNWVPPYSPNLSPVEMVFGVSKKKIWANKGKEKINFSKPSGKKVLVNVLKTLSNRTCMGMWLQFIWEAKKVMLETCLINETQLSDIEGGDRREIRLFYES